MLGHRDVKFPESRSLTRRLLYWDHLRDQVSYILCPPDTPDGDAVVYRAGLPVRLPPGTNVDDIAPQEPSPPIIKKKFDRPLADHDHSQAEPPRIEPIDLDEGDLMVDDAALYSSLSEPDALPPDCPFSFLYLSSEDSIREDNLDDLEQLNSLPDGTRKQGTTHIPVTAEQCGNKTHETFGRVSTTDLDTAMIRYLVSWGASSPDFTIASLDVTAAFLNAPLLEGRVVILKPPDILYKLQLLPPGHVWLVHKAICGLREAPNLWSEERTDMMTKISFSSEGESYSVILSQIHKSLCLLVKTRSLLKNPSTDQFGLTNLVLPEHVEAMSGIYVDDYLTAGPPHLPGTKRWRWQLSLQHHRCTTQSRQNARAALEAWIQRFGAGLSAQSLKDAQDALQLLPEQQ